MTETMKNLTQHSVDDSATVRIITYVSAIYLPASFVAVSFVKIDLPAKLTKPHLVPVWNELLRLRHKLARPRDGRELLDFHCDVAAVDSYHYSRLYIDALA